MNPITLCKAVRGAAGVLAAGALVSTGIDPAFGEPVAPAATPARLGQRLARSVHGAPIPAVTVAVIDTGVRSTHTSLAGRIVPGGWNVASGSADTSDAIGHGTLMASLVAARPGGAASELDPLVLPIRIFDSRSSNEELVSAGLAYSLGRAPIVNMSFAAVNPVSEIALRAAVAGGQLLVVAAGNRSLADPDWPARFAREGWANGQIIAVGAVDATNMIAAFSNRAGDAMNAFLVARGTNVTGGGYSSDSAIAVASGTSVAAPQVARIAGLVKALWPQLSAQQVAGVLFATARDLGAPGTDAIYGRGLVDETAALAPVGITRIPTSAGTAVPLSAAWMAAGPVAVTALRDAAAAGRFRGIALDAFNRQFQYDFGAGIGRAPVPGLDRLLGAGDRHFAASERVLANGMRLVYAIDSPLEGVAALGRADGERARLNSLGGVAIRLPLAERTELAAGTHGLAATFFGVAGADTPLAASAGGAAYANPLFAFAPEHTYLATGVRLADGAVLKAGVVTTAANDVLRAPLGGDLDRASPRVQIATAELGTTIGRGWIALSASQMQERGTALGLAGGEAWAVDAGVRTSASTLQAAWPLDERTAIVGQYTIASTSGFEGSGASLVGGASSIRSTASAIGLVRHEVLRVGDRLALTFAQPLRATSGALRFDLPVDVDAQGTIARTTETVSLRPSGRERTVELGYAMPLGRTARLTLAAVHRHEPDHDALAPAQRIVALRYSLGF